MNKYKRKGINVFKDCNELLVKFYVINTQNVFYIQKKSVNYYVKTKT